MKAQKSIKSFVKRNKRLTSSQKKFLESKNENSNFHNAIEILNYHQIFNNSNPCIMDIGFGDGKLLISIAKENPEKNFIGVEVYQSGIGRILKQISKHKLSNLVIFNHDAVDLLENYTWPGNIRQLKHITEQMSVLEADRRVEADTILSYLPETHRSRFPVRITTGSDGFEEGEAGTNEKKMLYNVLFDLKKELDDLKRVVLGIMENEAQISQEDKAAVQRAFSNDDVTSNLPVVQDAVEVESSLSLIDSERELIIKALDKHKNKRKLAAAELGISERTLYRKIKEYDLN